MERHKRLFWGLLAGLALLSLWLRQAIPLNVLGFAGVDDLLFASQARILAQGYWLGSYDNMTHAKGMMYPAFVAAAFHLGLPLKLAEHLLYLAAGALMAAVLARLAGRRVALLGFALLAFQPALWSADMARVTREGVYTALTMLLLAVAARLFLREEEEGDRRLGWPIVFGGLGGIYWLTREEGVWIVPSLAVLALFWLVRRWRCHRLSLGQALRRLALPLAVGLALIGTVNGINWVLYGVFRNVDFRSSDFLAAYGALTRVKTGEDDPRFLFTAPVRAQVFAASPAARELQPLFDGAFGENARKMVCEVGPPDEARRCDEIVSGWLPWVLRDAVRRLGHYKTAATADAYYRRLADEVDAACEAGTLSCLPPRRTMAPPFYPAFAWKAAQRLGQAAALLTFADIGPWQRVPLPTGTPDSIRLFQDVSNTPPPPLAAPGEGLFLGGWTAGSPTLSLRRRDGGDYPGHSELALLPAAEPGAMRFRLASDCAPADCLLAVRRAGEAEPRLIPLAPLPGAGLLLDVGTTKVAIEAAGPAEAALGLPLQQRMRTIKERVLRALTAGYAWIMPPLAALAVVAFAAALAGEVRRRTLSAASVLGVALLTAMAARMALLAYLDATSFQALLVYYMAPAYPPLCLFVVLALRRAPAYVARRWRLSRGGASASMVASTAARSG